MQTSSKAVVVFVAQNGPLISRRLDQLPVVPTVGVIFNFDNEYYQQTQPPLVSIGRTAGGKNRDMNVMLFDVLSMIHTPAEVIEMLRRRLISYSIPENGGGSIIQITDHIEPGCEDMVLVQCKRLPPPQNSSLGVSAMLASAVIAATEGEAAGVDKA